MLSVAPNIVFAPNITQNAECKQRTQNTNTAHNRLLDEVISAGTSSQLKVSNVSDNMTYLTTHGIHHHVLGNPHHVLGNMMFF